MSGSRAGWSPRTQELYDRCLIAAAKFILEDPSRFENRGAEAEAWAHEVLERAHEKPAKGKEHGKAD